METGLACASFFVTGIGIHFSPLSFIWGRLVESWVEGASAHLFPVVFHLQVGWASQGILADTVALLYPIRWFWK